MNAIELHTPAGKPANVFVCGKCKLVRGNERDFAEKCCVPPNCRFCDAALGERDGRTAHESCLNNDRFEKAEKLTEWDGWVFADGYGHGDGYFEDIGELIAACEDDGLDVPEWVFVCKEIPFPCARMDDITQRVEDELFENAWERVEGTKELQAAFDAFNELNKGLVSQYPDYKRVLLITPEPQTETGK